MVKSALQQLGLGQLNSAFKVGQRLVRTVPKQMFKLGQSLLFCLRSSLHSASVKVPKTSQFWYQKMWPTKIEILVDKSHSNDRSKCSVNADQRPATAL